MVGSLQTRAQLRGGLRVAVGGRRLEATVASRRREDTWWPARIALNIGKREFLAGSESHWVDACRQDLGAVRLRAPGCVAAPDRETGSRRALERTAGRA